MFGPVFEGIFSFSGRRNRKSFLLYSLAQSAVAAVLMLALGVAATQGEPVRSLIALVCGFPLLAVFISGWAVAVQRCHDFGWTGWATLITVLPIVGWGFALALSLVPGNAGDNRYGPASRGGRRWPDEWGETDLDAQGDCRYHPATGRLAQR